MKNNGGTKGDSTMKKSFQSKMKNNGGTAVNSKKDRVKKNFEKNLWSPAMLKVAVKKGELTVVEFESITGEKY